MRLKKKKRPEYEELKAGVAELHLKAEKWPEEYGKLKTKCSGVAP